jgi:ABC-type antimicrobial peptide transport system permease subunit
MFRISKIHIENAIESLNANRMRTFLTMLGVMIGIASITAIFALSGGVSSLISNQVSSEGAMTVVRPKEIGEKKNNLISNLTSSKSFVKSSLTEKDLEIVSKNEHVAAAAPLANFSAVVSGEGNSITSNVLATTPNLEKVISLPMRGEDSEFIAESLNSKNAVVGYQFAVNLFGTPDVIGRYLKIKDQQFLIIGVLEKQDSTVNFSNVDFDNSMIVNYSTAKNIIGELQIQQINAKIDSVNNLNEADSKISKQILDSHKNEQDFEVLSGEEISKTSSEIVDVAGVVLALVAGISLVVGGIGIMNIMLVNVSERTREIGIRKALGANNRHILMQFLTESMIISLGGGVFGFVLGLAFSFGVSLVLPFSPSISLKITALIGFISIAVGLIFGAYPALRASRKDPIESLRYYN